MPSDRIKRQVSQDSNNRCIILDCGVQTPIPSYPGRINNAAGKIFLGQECAEGFVLF